mmetsp:Transcript_35715/g.43094  ORF Transcript_35715/g.43094 Transcript_35715/m.43094 type:complete len:224 (+) Transcript_35715:1502-2173(+)
MVAEVEVLAHVDDVGGIILIFMPQMLENLDLYEGLVMKAFLISDDLYSTESVRFVVKALHYLPEAALAEGFEDLVAEADVVVKDCGVVSSLVVIAMVVSSNVWTCSDLVGAVVACEVYLRVLENFTLLELCECIAVKLQCSRCCHRQLLLVGWCIRRVPRVRSSRLTTVFITGARGAQSRRPGGNRLARSLHFLAGIGSLTGSLRFVDSTMPTESILQTCSHG